MKTRVAPSPSDSSWFDELSATSCAHETAPTFVLSVSVRETGVTCSTRSREPHCGRISARLVEQDSRLVQRARDRIEQAGLDSIDVVACDAAVTDAYVGAVPADLVLVCGVFGNVSDADVARIIGAMPQLCAHRASVIWTRHRRRPDLTPRIRAWFHEAGFVQRTFESPGAGSWSVGVHEFRGIPRQLRTNETLFTFVR
jgi:hypothetical protein